MRRLVHQLKVVLRITPIGVLVVDPDRGGRGRRPAVGLSGVLGAATVLRARVGPPRSVPPRASHLVGEKLICEPKRPGVGDMLSRFTMTRSVPTRALVIVDNELGRIPRGVEERHLGRPEDDAPFLEGPRLAVPLTC